jgi:predicted RNA-binding Zn-ribbon protein involved in translation (DUF1610 family)
MEILLTAIIVGALALLVGIVIGVRSKAQAKMRKRLETKRKERDFITDDEISCQGKSKTITQHLDEMLEDAKEGRQAPPPPAPRTSSSIKQRSVQNVNIVVNDTKLFQKDKPAEAYHMKPGILYDSGTFTSVNKCKHCGAIGQEYDMHTVNPCPKCGGDVKRHGAAKWVGNHWEMSKAKS